MRQTQTKLPDVDGLHIPPIRENPAYKAIEAELLALEKRFAETESRRKSALARAKGAKSSRSAVERARDLVAGGRVQGKPNIADELAAIAEEDQILTTAIFEATARLNEIGANLSFEISQKHRAVYDAAMVATLRAIEDLAAAIGVSGGLLDRMRAAGYRPTSACFPDVVPAAVWALGSPDHAWFSQAWRFKHTLEDMGII
jgi:hypothetical protein